MVRTKISLQSIYLRPPQSLYDDRVGIKFFLFACETSFQIVVSFRPPTARTNFLKFLKIPAGFRKTNDTMFVETTIPTTKPKRNENYIELYFERDREFLILLDVNGHSLLKQSFAPVSTELTCLSAKVVQSFPKRSQLEIERTLESSFPPRPVFSSLING